MIEMSYFEKRCVIVIDLDGTVIPILVDFEDLRSRIRRIIGTDHPLRPLGESLASLNISEDKKNQAWRLIEEEELESVNKLKLEEVNENVSLINEALMSGYEIVVVTMRSTTTAKLLLRKLGLGSLAEKLVTRDDFCSRRDQLKYLKQRYVSRELVFIGDTDHDEYVSRELGLRFKRVKNHYDFPRVFKEAIRDCTV